MSTDRYIEDGCHEYRNSDGGSVSTSVLRAYVVSTGTVRVIAMSEVVLGGLS